MGSLDRVGSLDLAMQNTNTKKKSVQPFQTRPHRQEIFNCWIHDAAGPTWHQKQKRHNIASTCSHVRRNSRVSGRDVGPAVAEVVGNKLDFEKNDFFLARNPLVNFQKYRCPSYIFVKNVDGPTHVCAMQERNMERTNHDLDLRFVCRAMDAHARAHVHVHTPMHPRAHARMRV